MNSAPVLAAQVWQARERAHHERTDLITEGMRERAARGQGHPVEDFLTTYYPNRLSRLRRWSPGPGVILAGHDGGGHWVPTVGGVILAPAGDRVRRHAARAVEILTETAGRAPQFGCFGLHEWAMVYRQDPAHLRHPAPLRLGAQETSTVVEQLPLRCTHFDAFRFFTEPARPLNAVQPTRAAAPALEQGGCLHANMDLYRWAYGLAPWIAAELVTDAFALARRIRVLDMRASPYDLSAVGLDPVRVETPQGRREYALAQRGFAAEAAVLRPRVLDAARALLV